MVVGRWFCLSCCFLAVVGCVFLVVVGCDYCDLRLGICWFCWVCLRGFGFRVIVGWFVVWL